jgi:hypothetical protein
VRRIPLRLVPIEGESLDSWIVAYAARLELSISVLAHALRLDLRWLRHPARDVALGGRPDEVVEFRSASEGCGVDLDDLRRPMARYAERAHHRFGPVELARAAAPMRWSRFCPDCLGANGGRWAAIWRLPWCVACPEHQCFLLSACGRCEGRQRQRPLNGDVQRPQTTTCSMPRPGASGRGEHHCGHDLVTEQAGGKVPVEVLRMQQGLAGLLDPDIEHAALAAGIDRLADLVGTAALLRPDADAFLRKRGLDRVEAIGAALVEAQEVLTDASDRRLSELIAASAERSTSARVLPFAWAGASPELVARVLSIRDSSLGPADRLRWRSTTTPRRPTQSEEATDSLVGSVPHALWLDWSIRLGPPPGVGESCFRAVAIAAMMLPGSTARLPDLVSDLSEDPASFARTVTYVLRTICATDGDGLILGALTRLGDALRTHGSPIDYRRRRRLGASIELLNRRSWDRICASVGILTGGQRKLHNARLWIWETVTGGPLQRLTPGGRAIDPTAGSDLDERGSYLRFLLNLPTPASQLLEAHARALLDEHGCADEPLTWSPPIDWVAGACLPGSEPDDIDRDEIWRLLYLGLSPGQVAVQARTTIGHVRFVMCRVPQNIPRGPHAQESASVRTALPEQLTPARLRRLVVDENRSVHSIAEEFAVGRKPLTSALRREGIPVPARHGRLRHQIDPDWLRAQYVDEQRTLPDIAAEIGTTPPNLARVAAKHGIPLRERGGASHAASLRVPLGFPEPLASAVLGQGGWGRVRRFQICARSRSINHAAKLVGCKTNVLWGQVAHLERACGRPLIVRATRRQERQVLTPLGRRLLAQADEHLGPNPDAPPALPPPPLGDILGLLAPELRLQRFEVAARSRTVAEAASVLRLRPFVVNAAISALEGVVGGVLISRATAQDIHRVTPLGRRLLQQMFGAGYTAG